LEGRKTGSNGAKKAKNFLINYFQKNTKTTIDSFTYNLENKSIKAENIVGIIDNKADSFIIFMAHYDHIGYGGEKSRSLTNNKIHPGADDNASGIAALLQIMNNIKENNLKKVNFVFIALSGHEDGLFGSKYFVKAHQEILNKTIFVVNLDMVGRMNKNNPVVKIISNNLVYFKPLIEQLSSLSFHYSDDWNNNDIEAFVNKNIKSLSLTTGIHENYHKISDTADKINYHGICEIIRLINHIITSLQSN
jgi:Zn-dependent M28 family amino/carboxypeptidase